ncbi:MAG: hypothetical protein WCI84_09365 [Bacteroidota bacterium]
MNKMLVRFAGLYCLISVHLLVAQPNPSLFSSDSLLIIVPFVDHSGFNGKWVPAIDIPRFVSAYTKERFRVGIISPVPVKQFAKGQKLDTLQYTTPAQIKKIAEHFHVRYIVSAEIIEFTIGRFMVSEVQLAGYEAFSAEVSLKFALYDAARLGSGGEALLYEGEAAGSVKDRGLGITLFGKQTDRTSQYFSLDDIAFGSEAFNKTIIGEALLKCADDLSTKIERAIPALISKNVVLASSVVIDSTSADSAITLKRQLINGEIVIVDDDQAFINLGSQDGIKIGDILPVFGGEKNVTDPKTGERLGSREEKTGEVQVIEIRAEHLCLSAIISGKGKIIPKQRVRKIIVR